MHDPPWSRPEKLSQKVFFFCNLEDFCATLDHLGSLERKLHSTGPGPRSIDAKRNCLQSKKGALCFDRIAIRPEVWRDGYVVGRLRVDERFEQRLPRKQPQNRRVSARPVLLKLVTERVHTASGTAPRERKEWKMEQIKHQYARLCSEIALDLPIESVNVG